MHRATQRIEGDTWLCREHLNELLYSPENIAANNAQHELYEFTEAGGVLS